MYFAEPIQILKHNIAVHFYVDWYFVYFKRLFESYNKQLNFAYNINVQ